MEDNKIYKYEITVDGQTHQVSKNNIDKYGIEKYAEDYPGATIRMRDKDNNDYDIPLSDYKRAESLGLRNYLIGVSSSSHSSKKEKKQNVGSEAQRVVQEYESYQRPDAVVQPNQTVQTRQMSYAPQQPAEQKDNKKTEKKDKQQQLKDYRNSKNAEAVVGRQPAVSGSFEDTMLYRYIQPEFANRVVERVGQQADDVMKADVSGGYPQAVDVMQATQERTRPLFRNVVTGAIAESKKKAVAQMLQEGRKREFGLNYRQALSFPLLQQRQYNEEVTPSKIFERIKNQIGKDANFGNVIREEAARLEVTPQEYISQYALPELQNELYNQLIEAKVPKSSAEYIFSNAMASSIAGMLTEYVTKPLETRQLEAEARGRYNANRAEEVGSMAASIVLDLPVMSWTGGLGSSVSKTLVNGQVKRMMAAGLTREAAEGIAMRTAQQTGMKWGLRSASEAANFGAYEGLANVVSQLHQKDEVDAKEAGIAFSKGALTGAAMGIYGVGNERIGRALTHKAGDKAGRVLTYAGSLGGRTTILAGSSVLGSWMSDPNFDVNNVDWTDEFVQAGLTNLGFDLISASKSIGKKRIRTEEYELNDNDIRQLNEAGVKGRNAKEIAESLSNVNEAARINENAAEKGIITREWAGIQQEYDISNTARQFGEIMSNPNIDLATKSKVGYIMTGKLFKLSPSTGISRYYDDATGEYIVDTYNTAGQRNERRRFTNKDDADIYYNVANSQVKRNQVSGLEGIVTDADRMKASIEAFDNFVERGYSRREIIDIYNAGKNGKQLSKEQREIYDGISAEIERITKGSESSVDMALYDIMEAYGYDMIKEVRKEINRLNKKDYYKMKSSEQKMYDDYIEALRRRTGNNEGTEAGPVRNDRRMIEGIKEPDSELQRQEQETGTTGVERYSSPTQAEVDINQIPEYGVSVRTENNAPAFDNAIKRGRQKAVEDYNGGDYNISNIRKYGVHTRMAGQRLARFFDREQIQNILAMDEAQYDSFVKSLPIEEQQVVDDYVEAVRNQDEFDKLARQRIDQYENESMQLAESMVGEIPDNIIIAYDKGKQYVILNGYMRNSGEYLAVPLSEKNGTLDYESFDRSNMSTIRLSPYAKIAQVPTTDIYTENQLAEMEKYNNALYGGYNIGENVAVSLDGEGIVRATVVNKDNKGNYYIQFEGEKDPSFVSSEEMTDLANRAYEVEYSEAYQAIDEQIGKIIYERGASESQPAPAAAQPEASQPAPTASQPEAIQPAPAADQPEASQPAPTAAQPEASQTESAASQPEASQPESAASQPEASQPAPAASQPDASQPVPASQPESDVPDFSVDRSEDARARGYRVVNGNRVDRQGDIGGYILSPTQIKFSNDVVVDGEYMITDADMLQPSHTGRNKNPLYFISEAQPKERTDEASTAAAERIARDINPREITEGTTAYTGTPVINSRGEVIQGNNRTSAIKTMYDSYPESAEKYKDYIRKLVNESERSAIDAINHPVLVRVTPVTDADAIKLGQMTARDTESGGYERINPRQTYVKLSDSAGSFSSILLASDDDEDLSISELISKNGINALKFLVNKNVISNTQYQSAINKDGQLTPEAKQDISGILENSLFEGGIDRLPEMFRFVPQRAQKAILQTFYKDDKSPEKARIKADIQSAIEIVYEAMQDDKFARAKDYKSAINAINDWKRQKNMYTNVAPSEIYSNFALELAARMKVSSTKQLVSDFNSYYDLVQGQKDLFTSDIEVGKDEALKQIFDLNGSKGNDSMEGRTSQGEEGRPGSTEATGGQERTVAEGKPEDSGRTTQGSQNVISDGQGTSTQDSRSADTVNDTNAVPEGGGEKQKRGTETRPEVGRDAKKRQRPAGSYERGTEDRVQERDEAASQKSGNDTIDESGNIEHQIKSAESQVDKDPTQAQKDAGNYRKGHLKFDGFDFTIENVKGGTRSGVDANGKEWSVTMNNTYGYIRGTEGVDGDHIDVFISNKPTQGNVYVVDQVNSDGTFDEHKVMYGFPTEEEAKKAYLSNYEDDWKGLGNITEVSRDEFKKWIDSSKRKTKPFAEYKGVKKLDRKVNGPFREGSLYVVEPVSRIDDIADRKMTEIAAFYNGIRSDEGEMPAYGFDLFDDAQKFADLMNADDSPLVKSDKVSTIKDEYQSDSDIRPGQLYVDEDGNTLEILSYENGKYKYSETNGDTTFESEAGLEEIKNTLKYYQKQDGQRERNTEPVEAKTDAIEGTSKECEDRAKAIEDRAGSLQKEDGGQKTGTVGEILSRAESKANELIDRIDNITEDLHTTLQDTRKNSDDISEQIQKINKKLSLLGVYIAPDRPPYEKIRNKQSAKVLEKSMKTFAKNMAVRLGGHVDKKDLKHIANIAPIGGECSFRVWFNDEESEGVYFVIRFESKPDYEGGHQPLNINDGYWRFVTGEDRSGIKSKNNLISTSDKKKLESGELMSSVADKILNDYGKRDLLPRQGRKSVQVVGTQPAKENAKGDEEKKPGGGNVETGNAVSEPVQDTDKTGVDGRTSGGDSGQQRVSGGRTVTEPGEGDTGKSSSKDVQPVAGGNEQPDRPVESVKAEEEKQSEEVNATVEEAPQDVQDNDKVKPSVIRNSGNFRFGKDHIELPKGEIGKIKANIEAIRILKDLESSGRMATDEEKKKLLQYVGWGGLSEVLSKEKYERSQKYPWESWATKYKGYHEQIREIMTDDEFNSAIQSTTTGHFTPETVIRFVWDALEYMGFKGGYITEPAMGIGHMLGFMPESVSQNSVINGFELDDITGRIAKQLYPDAAIKVAGYETEFHPNSKDAIVTNVPFDKNAPYDSQLDKVLRKRLGTAYNLHNYFIVKGLLELKRGGIGAFITSSSTMDGRNEKMRAYLREIDVDLIGAIRLPNDTFLKNAGTQVTSDILFFRKRFEGEPSNGINFTSLTQIGDGTYQVNDPNNTLNKITLTTPIFVNEYFADHPEMMLGTMMTAHDAGSGGLYGGDSLTLVPRKDSKLENELANAVTMFPENIINNVNTISTEEQATTNSDGVISVSDGKVYVSESGVNREIAKGTFKYNGKTRKYEDAARDYIDIKTKLRDLIKKEQTEKDDPEELRQELNRLYDSFVDKYGYLNGNRNLDKFLKEDFERFLPQSLEDIKTVIDPETGRKKKVISKGKGILTRRVNQPMIEPDKAENISDAIGISMAYRGHIDVPYISRMLNISEEEARDKMLSSGEVYEDPLTGSFVDRDTYLSGNIRDKIEIAREAAKNDSKYEVNLMDLEAVMPANIPFNEIRFKLGSTWIPTSVYADFCKEGMGYEDVSITYIPATDSFLFEAYGIADYVKNGDFGTSEVKASDLFRMTLNMKKPSVFKEGADGTKVKDDEATQSAIQKQIDMDYAFIDYVNKRSDLHPVLEQIYNERYNSYRLREYHAPNFGQGTGRVNYPGLSENITLREHQVKAIQRSLISSTLLAHQVGTGKTFTMITTAMEMRRLGIAKKPLIVVQNATLNDFAADFMKLYPGANILVPNEDERNASNRKRLFNLIATGDFDAIIIPQSFLAFIPDDPSRKEALIQKRIDELNDLAEEMASVDRSLSNKLKKEAFKMELEAGGYKGKTVKQEAKRIASAKSKEERKLDRRTDDVITFEQMGIDALFIDEAHNFKKIGFNTKMQNVKGVDTGYSERANSLLLKASYIQEKNGGRNVILATGTPITNTMAEVWTMMRFVAPDILEDYHIDTFDRFASTYGSVEPSLEQTSTGGFKIADRFKSYINVPELVKAFRSHADVVLTSDVQEFKEGNSIPKLKDGKMTNFVLEKTDAISDVIDTLIKTLDDDQKKSKKERTPGLPLVVFQKAKQASIDLRLLNPSFPDDPGSKTNKVVAEVKRIYDESSQGKGVQMVFCDSYQSPSSMPVIDLFGYDPNVSQFNIYKDMKNKLVSLGIPEKEIVIVNDINSAERKKDIFQKARDGEIRVLLGSTEKMGVGVNVQDRMIALHHVDAPLRPMDFEQRNGRILRQGNIFAAKNIPVEVITYGVNGTLDATAYDRLRIKQNFINQMMKGDISGRVLDDESDDDPSGKTFSQMAAELSGNKVAQLLFIAENKYKKLNNLKQGYLKKQTDARIAKPVADTRLLRLNEKLILAEDFLSHVNKNFENGIEVVRHKNKAHKEKMATVMRVVCEDYQAAYEANRNTPPVVFTFNNSPIRVIVSISDGRLVYSMVYEGVNVVYNRETTPAGIWRSINNQFQYAADNVESIRKEIRDTEGKIKGYENIMQKPFEKENELRETAVEVERLKAELIKEGEKEANKEIKSRIDGLKRSNVTVSSPVKAGQSYESLDMLDGYISKTRETVNNAPEPIVLSDISEIRTEFRGLSPLMTSKVVSTARRENVRAMYVPYNKQIVLLPDHGTAEEIRDAYFHESVHYAIDAIIPHDDNGRLSIERAGEEARNIDPELASWIDENYKTDRSEEMIAHVMENIFSYMAGAGKQDSIRGGIDFGSEYPVLNDIANKVIKFLTEGENEKDKDNKGRNQGVTGRDQEENGIGGTETDTTAIQEQEIKLAVKGKPRKKAGESDIAYYRRLKEWEAIQAASGVDVSSEVPSSVYYTTIAEDLQRAQNRIDTQNIVISELEKALKRHEEGDDVRKIVYDIVKDKIDRNTVSEFNKTELNGILRQLKTPSSGKKDEAIEKAIMTVSRIVNQAQLRMVSRLIDRLLSLKTQDVNGKNMSIAKNVDDSTRKIIDFIKGRATDLRTSGYEDDIRYIRRENVELKQQIDNKERSLKLSDDEDEKANLISDIEEINQKIEENKQRISELKEMAESVIKDKAEIQDADIDAGIQEMNDKMDDYVSGKGKWTVSDNERLTALNLMKDIREFQKMGEEAAKTNSEIEELSLNRSTLYKERSKEAYSDKRKKITDKINAINTQIRNTTQLMNMQIQQQVERMIEFSEKIRDLIAGGKDNLKRKIENDNIRKAWLISNTLSDISDKPVDEFNDDARKESAFGRYLAKPLYSFEYLAKAINRNTLGEDGFFYNQFVRGDEGVLEAFNVYQRGLEYSRNQLDKKSNELFGKTFDHVAGRSDEVVNNSGVYITDEYGVMNPESAVKFEKPLSKGQAMYIYMVWKMKDGRMKLEKQGFTDESIEEIKQFIGDKYIQLADFIQGELLPELREKYNERYVEIYNTSLDKVDNYVPLRIRKESVRQETNLQEGGEVRRKSLEERAGSLIRRVVNTKPVDITMSAFDVISRNLDEMEEWYAYAKVRRDLDSVLSSTTVRNQINANSRGMFNNLYEAAAVATRSFRPDRSGFMDEFIGKLSKGIVGGNIAWRLSTALKQVLSAPAFFGYSQSPLFAGYYIKSLSNPVKTFKWAIENLPSFRVRVESGTVGNEKLTDDKLNKFFEDYINIGMWPNRMIDAVTCSTGAKAIYDYKLKKLTDSGINEDEAKKIAMMDADIFYNATQQSAHPAFLSPTQMSRSIMDRLLTTYQNSNISYVRKWFAEYNDLKKSMDFKRLQESYEAEFIKQGKDPATAKSMAKSRILNSYRKKIVGLMLFAWGLNKLWEIGSLGLLGFLHSDDGETRQKNPLIKPVTTFVTSPGRGLPVVNMVENVINGRDLSPVFIFSEINDLLKETENINEMYGVFSPEMAYSILERSSVVRGVDLETWSNVYIGVEDMIKNGAQWDDILIDMMYVANFPRSNRMQVARELYRDSDKENYIERLTNAGNYIVPGSGYRSYLPGARDLTSTKAKDFEKQYELLNMTDEEREKYHALEVMSKVAMDDKELKEKWEENSDADTREALVKKMYKLYSDENRQKTIESVLRSTSLRYGGLPSNKEQERRYLELSSYNDIMDDIRMKERLSELKPYNDQFYEYVKNGMNDEAEKYLKENSNQISSYKNGLKIGGQVTRLKKAITGKNDEEVIKQIRNVRKQFFDVVR